MIQSNPNLFRPSAPFQEIFPAFELRVRKILGHVLPIVTGTPQDEVLHPLAKEGDFNFPYAQVLALNAEAPIPIERAFRAQVGIAPGEDIFHPEQPIKGRRPIKPPHVATQSPPNTSSFAEGESG